MPALDFKGSEPRVGEFHGRFTDQNRELLASVSGCGMRLISVLVRNQDPDSYV